MTQALNLPMFTDPAVQAVFALYEARDADDQRRRSEMGPAGFAVRDEFLLPVGPDVGRFLNALVLAHRPGRIIELGTSYGYSTLFLAEAARRVGARIVSLDVADYKQAYARDMLVKAGLLDAVDFHCGDAVAWLEADAGPFDLVLIDIWKELYIPCFRALRPRMAEGGLIIADNMLDPPVSRPEARAYREEVAACAEFQTMLLPFGSGIEVSVKRFPEPPGA